MNELANRALNLAQTRGATYADIRIIDLETQSIAVKNGIVEGVALDFKCMGQEEAIVINVPTEPYNHAHPDEYRVDPYQNEIPYDWRLKEE